MQNLQLMRASLPVPRPGAEVADPARRWAPAPQMDGAGRGLDGLVAAQLDLLDRIDLAAAVLGRDQRIVRLNRRCERILGCGLARRCDRLLAHDRRSNERLRSALQAVFASPGNGAGPEAECGLIVGEPHAPILFRVLPLGSSPLDGRPACALLMLSSPQLRSAVDAGLLSSAFDLTPAQARLARQLATGASLDAAAARLGIKKETARNHLKQIFLRTGTRRQGELVALLSAFWLAAAADGRPPAP